MIPVLQIRLLGNFSLAYHGSPVTTVNMLRLQSLLAYLVLHRHAPQSRHHLAFLLWPDTTESQAHTNLRNLLHRLRRALPEADLFLQIDGQTVQWRPEGPFTLDVADFERAAAQASSAALQEAISLYRGDLLPGCYDEWLLTKREQLRQTFAETLERLAQTLEAQRDYDLAIHYAHRLLQHDPVHEVTCRRLMRIYALNGDRAAALRTYHTCATLLQQELAVEPGPATREVYERLLNLEVSSVAPPSPSLAARSPLIGRDQEWDRLRQAWRDAAQGRPHFILISGEAGIGKTRLAEELGEWAKRQGIATASAHCYAAERGLAYAPVVAWLQTGLVQSALSKLAEVWLVEIARLVPELLVERPELPQPGPLTESWQRRRLFEALARATLACTGKSQPLLLQIDDLQWSDPETLEWLAYLLRFAPQAPLLIVGTLRPEEVEASDPVAALLLSLRRDQQFSEIELGPLDAAKTATLAASVADQELNPNLAVLVYQETEGNPLFVVETMRAGVLEQQSDPSQRFLLASLSPTIQAVITARLSQLSPSARQLAGLAAVIGRDFTFEVLAQASPDDEDTLIRGLDELWQRRIVRERGTHTYDFSHDKIREVAYTELSAARRRLLHRRVAKALESLYASNLDPVSSQIAAHYERAGLLERAVPYYQRAAEVAHRLYANEEVIEHLRQALALLEAAPLDASKKEWRLEMTTQLHERLGDILYLTGQYTEARDTFQTALTYVPKIEAIWQARLHYKVGNTWRLQYHYTDALQAYELAETGLGPEPVESSVKWWQEWIQIQLEQIRVYYWLDQWPQMAELAEKARSAVEQYGTPPQRAKLLNSVAIMNMRRDRYVVLEETLTLNKAALAINQATGTLSEISFAQFEFGFALLWHGDFNEAEEQMFAALRLAERIGDVKHQARCLTYLTITYRKQSQVEKVKDYIAHSLAAATVAHMPAYIGTAQANFAWVAWREGNFVEAQESGHAALTTWQQLPTGHGSCCFQWTALWPLMAISLTRNHLVKTIDYARLLLVPPQQRLPDLLAALVSEAIQAWDADQLDMAKFHLNQAIEIAQKMKYL